MKSKFAVLHYDIKHFTNTSYIDANVIPFEGISEISLLYLTSKTIDLNKCKFEFNLNFTNWAERHYLSTDKVWPLFSNDLIAVILKHYSDLVYFPAKLIDKKGNEHINKFSVVQITRLSGIVNLEESKYIRDEYFPKLFSSVDQIVFNSNAKLNPIFRIYEYPQVLIVDEKLYRDLLEHEFKNLVLTEFEDYDWNYL